jgi:hypothetical protein
MVPLSVPRFQVRRVRLSRLRAKGFHHRIAADGIGERTAEARVPGIGKAGRRSDKAHRHQNRVADIDDRAQGNDEAHDRPMAAEQQGSAYQHDDAGQKGDEQDVVERIERPHAARYLADSGAGKAVGVPICREALHAIKAVIDDFSHHLERQPDHPVKDEKAQENARQPESDHDGKRGQRVIEPAIPALADRVDDAAGEQRHHDFGHGGDHDEAGNQGDTPRLLGPVTEGEAENALEGVGAEIEFLATHLAVRLPSRAPAPCQFG